MTQTCFAGSYGLILILCGPAAAGSLEKLVVLGPVLDLVSVAIQDKEHVMHATLPSARRHGQAGGAHPIGIAGAFPRVRGACPRR